MREKQNSLGEWAAVQSAGEGWLKQKLKYFKILKYYNTRTILKLCQTDKVLIDYCQIRSFKQHEFNLRFSSANKDFWRTWSQEIINKDQKYLNYFSQNWTKLRTFDLTSNLLIQSIPALSFRIGSFNYKIDKIVKYVNW